MSRIKFGCAVIYVALRRSTVLPLSLGLAPRLSQWGEIPFTAHVFSVSVSVNLGIVIVSFRVR